MGVKLVDLWWPFLMLPIFLQCWRLFHVWVTLVTCCDICIHMLFCYSSLFHDCACCGLIFLPLCWNMSRFEAIIPLMQDNFQLHTTTGQSIMHRFGHSHTHLLTIILNRLPCNRSPQFVLHAHSSRCSFNAWSRFLLFTSVVFDFHPKRAGQDQVSKMPRIRSSRGICTEFSKQIVFHILREIGSPGYFGRGSWWFLRGRAKVLDEMGANHSAGYAVRVPFSIRALQ